MRACCLRCDVLCLCLGGDETLPGGQSWPDCISIVAQLADWTSPHSYPHSGGIRELGAELAFARFGIAPIILGQQLRDGRVFKAGREVDIAMWERAGGVDEVSTEVYEDQGAINVGIGIDSRERRE